jgi:hypothetical protein
MRVRLYKNTIDDYNQCLYKVVFVNKKSTTIFFGIYPEENYTIHKDAKKLRSYIYNMKGVFNDDLFFENDPETIRKAMLNVTKTNGCNWDNIYEPIFWERWLLNTHKTLEGSKKWVSQNKGIIFI